MALAKRHAVLITRLFALVGLLRFRGKERAASWLLHDFLWLYPTLRRNCAWHGEVITRFETTEREIWLTIDDGPDPRDTPDILGLLAKHNAKATFFVIGEKVDAHRPLARAIAEAGHTLGNHTQTHPANFWWVLPRPLVRQQIATCQSALRTAVGLVPRWFRSPVGMNNSSVHPAASASGLRVIGWSAAGGDGCPATPTQIVDRIMRNVRPGAIILLHESGQPYRCHCKGRSHRSCRRALTLSRLLDRLTAEGYRCVLPPEAALR